jgi:hypothetical protein
MHAEHDSWPASFSNAAHDAFVAPVEKQAA